MRSLPSEAQREVRATKRLSEAGPTTSPSTSIGLMRVHTEGTRPPAALRAAGGAGPSLRPGD